MQFYNFYFQLPICDLLLSSDIQTSFISLG